MKSGRLHLVADRPEDQVNKDEGWTAPNNTYILMSVAPEDWEILGAPTRGRGQEVERTRQRNLWES